MAQAPGDGHHYFEEMAVAHVLGGLDESDGRLFRSHLLECSNCRARVGELRALAHDLADVERDERRVRATKAIETKRRETDDVDESEPPPSPPPRGRVPRLVGIIGVILVLGLAGWNFMLRGTVSNQDVAVENVQRAATVLLFGEEPGWINVRDDAIDAEVRTHEGDLAVLIDGASATGTYVLYQLDEEDRTIEAGPPIEPTGGRLFLLAPLRDGVERVVVTSPDSTPRPEPDGRWVVEARL